MNNINVHNVNNVAQVGGTAVVPSEKEKYLVAMKNHSLMGQAMCTMGDMMLLFTELANAKFQQMSNKMAVARDAQNMANKVEIALTKLAKDGDTAEVPADVIEYLKQNNILVEDMTIDEYVAKHGTSMPKSCLLSIQKSLEHTSGTASDFVQQSQLKLQQLMQNFNTAVTMANSIQSMNAESTKSIAQSIR